MLRQNRDALSRIGFNTELVDIYCKYLSDGMSTPYMRSFIQLSAKDNLAKTHVPLLALNGMKDTQVNYIENLDAVKYLIPHNPFTVKSYEGLNHFFQHSETGTTDEYGKIEETISPEVLSDIIGWIKSLK